AVWGSEYLAINPRARRVFLTCLGLGGLIRFAGMAASGLVRLANPLSWRALIFPGKAPFFKGIWLMAGAFFIVVFFSRKAAGFNMPEMRENLEKKLAGDLRLVALFLSRIDERDAKIKKLLDSVDAREKDELLKRQKEVINSLIDIRDSLNPDQKTFLTQKLARAGIETSDDDFIIWRAAEHDALYDTVGLINDGDRARVLKPAENWNGKIVKGRAQRVY
ncbi:MAG: hypothetical protein K2H64_04800, partial [Desulfovibrio sp.]|nr:hypothetical protein [Desulfovibrio sp.]